MRIKTKLRLVFTSLILLFSLLLLGPAQARAQQEEAKQEETVAQEAPVQAINLADIASETEKMGQRIRKLKEILSPQAKSFEVDSILRTTYLDFQTRRDSLLNLLPSLDGRDLQGVLVEWEGHKSELKDYQGIIDSRIEVLNDISDEVVVEIKRWQSTKQSLTENTEASDRFVNIDTMVVKLQGIVDEALIRLDSVFVIQKRLTDVVLVADEVIAEIGRAQLQLQKDYFVIDSPPIWKFRQLRSLARDTLIRAAAGNAELPPSRIEDDILRLWTFMTLKSKNAIFQLLFILLVYTLLMVVKRKWQDNESELTNVLEREARKIIQNPVASAITAGMLVSTSFYDVIIPVYKDFIILVILITTVYLLPRLSFKKILVPLILLLLAYFLNSILIYFTHNLVLSRFLLLVASLAISVSLGLGRKVMQNDPEKFPNTGFFRRFVLPVYLMLSLVGIVANIAGMVRLAQFLASAILLSVSLAAVIYVSVKVITSIIILTFKLRNQYQLSSIGILVEIIQKRVRPTLVFVGIIVWISFTLQGFGLFDYLNLWMHEVLEIHWKIGEMNISVGGILSFTVIFIVTMLVARIIANIFQDTWLISVLPRGIAPAISIIIRIILIATGFYMGLSAAGFDLSKISLLLGALGVGIGFGLQSIVLNFISGLILAFERPINLGDAIEVDNEMGIVTSIGVRASNIRTLKGSEVIIPNGDLVSKKVVNWTLSNRDRRSKILMKTSPDADPEIVIALFNRIAAEHPSVYDEPEPKTHFYGYNHEGNLDFALIYWTSFSDTLQTDSEVALKIFKTLREEGIQAPIPRWKIEGNDERRKQ